jgi:phospholipase/carboxylesterase
MQLLYTSHVPAGSGPFPTILSLHGWGASAHDLLGLAPLLHGGRALVLCPQGPVAFPVGPNTHGYGWFPLASGSPPDPEEFSRAASQVRDFLAEAGSRYPIDPAKLVVLGFSQGGVMAFDAFLRDPEHFAGCVALSSWLPPHVADATKPTDALRERPLLVMHGTNDPMISVDRARESRERLQSLGANLTYREYPMAHEIAAPALRELLGWTESTLA